MIANSEWAQRQDYDPLLKEISDYVTSNPRFSEETYKTARYCLLDSLGCAYAAQSFPACTTLLGSIVPNQVTKYGARVPGTDHVLDPAQAAFNIGAMIRWLDFNDTWLAAEWGHPSDNLGAILAVADYLDQNGATLTMQNVLDAMIMAYEIQGVIALTTAFNRVGIDHVILVRIASTAVVAKMLGLSGTKIMDALSLAWVDGGALRTYRHAPNTGSRKSWAAGDACRRAVELCYLVVKGEMGYPTCMSTPKWGVHDVLLGGEEVIIFRPLGSHVMDNILFKVGYPAEFHAQTAVEAAVALSPQIQGREEEIEKVVIYTHESAKRIIDKQGPLDNPADRDHCMQYMVATALLNGDLTAEMYENEYAKDPRIDVLRAKIELEERQQYSLDYLDSEKRSIANQLEIHLTGGEIVGPLEVEFPLGHIRRREEAWPKLQSKFAENTQNAIIDAELASQITDGEDFTKLRVSEFMGKLVVGA